MGRAFIDLCQVLVGVVARSEIRESLQALDRLTARSIEPGGSFVRRYSGH